MSMLPAAILAGGLSSRMGGGDKCLLRIGAATVLDRITAALAAQADAILINSNSAPELFRKTGLPVCADAIPGRLGPLAGILTAMLWARDLRAAFVLTVPSDTPFLPADLAARLRLACTDDRVVVAESGSRLHPTTGLWPVALADRLKRDIEGGARSVRAWLATISYDAVSFDADSEDPFFNINTPSDWEQANARV